MIRPETSSLLRRSGLKRPSKVSRLTSERTKSASDRSRNFRMTAAIRQSRGDELGIGDWMMVSCPDERTARAFTSRAFCFLAVVTHSSMKLFTWQICTRQALTVSPGTVSGNIINAFLPGLEDLPIDRVAEVTALCIGLQIFGQCRIAVAKPRSQFARLLHDLGLSGIQTNH
jgi:hypothetical protein